jgi:hypothetical protein
MICHVNRPTGEKSGTCILKGSSRYIHRDPLGSPAAALDDT